MAYEDPEIVLTKALPGLAARSGNRLVGVRRTRRGENGTTTYTVAARSVATKRIEELADVFTKPSVFPVLVTSAIGRQRIKADDPQKLDEALQSILSSAETTSVLERLADARLIA